MGKYRPPLIFLALSAGAFVLMWAALMLKDFAWSGVGSEHECRSCHSGPKAKELGLDDIYAKIEALPYKHSVVEEDKCDQCHIIRGLRKGRTWELSSPYAQEEQLFFLKDLSLDRKYQVIVKAKDGNGNDIPVTSLQFIPAYVTSAVENDQRAPIIKEVKVEEIRQAIFLEASLSWKTDKPSNAVIECGLTPQYEETAVYEKVFTTSHRITISGLQKGQRYRCHLLSRDIFGNISSSEDFILDTSREINKEESSHTALDRKKPVLKEVNIFKTKGTRDIYLKLVSDKPVKAYIEVNEPSEWDKHGFGLVSARVSRIDACVRCHLQGASHPVGIKSKGVKTKIPPILPTIEGGIITCVTCHHPHGGEKRHFARLNFGRDLCIQCHTGDSY